MEQNVGSSDKLLRTALGAVAGLLSIAILANVVSLPVAASPVLGLVAIVMLATGTVGMCPIYSLLGVDSCSRGSRPS